MKNRLKENGTLIIMTIFVLFVLFRLGFYVKVCLPYIFSPISETPLICITK